MFREGRGGGEEQGSGGATDSLVVETRTHLKKVYMGIKSSLPPKNNNKKKEMECYMTCRLRRR